MINADVMAAISAQTSRLASPASAERAEKTQTERFHWPWGTALILLLFVLPFLIWR
jgi:hypothetical protein